LEGFKQMGQMVFWNADPRVADLQFKVFAEGTHFDADEAACW